MWSGNREPEAMSGAIDMLLGDAGLARRLSEAGRARAAAFDLGVTVAAYADLLEEVAAERRRTR